MSSLVACTKPILIVSSGATVRILSAAWHGSSSRWARISAVPPRRRIASLKHTVRFAGRATTAQAGDTDAYTAYDAIPRFRISATNGFESRQAQLGEHDEHGLDGPRHMTILPSRRDRTRPAVCKTRTWWETSFAERSSTHAGSHTDSSPSAYRSATASVAASGRQAPWCAFAAFSAASESSRRARRPSAFDGSKHSRSHVPVNAYIATAVPLWVSPPHDERGPSVRACVLPGGVLS